jgi:hypothetical protein
VRGRRRPKHPGPLLQIKWTVKEHDCSLTRELVALIDREADLLNRWLAAGCRLLAAAGAGARLPAWPRPD